MKKRTELGAIVKARLEKTWTVRQEDIGEDACLKKNGMAFTTESYTVEGVGHLCVMRMNAMLGLMQMETVVLSATEKDLPLFNLDWVRAFGKETQIAELYDVQLQPLGEEAQAAFRQIKERDADLEEYVSAKEHWYDPILYPFSYHKTGKGAAERMSGTAQEYVRVYAELLEAAPPCDREEKTARVRSFAQTLFEQGGPAVDQVTKLFGKETASRLILRHMYGV